MIVLGWLFAAAAIVALCWWLLKSFTSATPRAVLAAMKLFAASFVAMASMGFLAFGRFGLLIALIGSVALTIGRLRAQRRPPDPIEGEVPGASGESAVETTWLSMRLDRASGQMNGHVRCGRFAGRTLASLEIADLLALREELVTAEPTSLPLIETWLDRIAPDWRGRDEAGTERRSHATFDGGPLDEAAALDILGLRPGAERADIEAAYRRMMAQVHPDKGGSDHLASLVNAARAFLLNRA